MLTLAAELPPEEGNVWKVFWHSVLQINTVHCWCMTLTLIPKRPSSSHAEIQACDCWSSWQYKLYPSKRRKGKNSQHYTPHSCLWMAANTRPDRHLGYSYGCSSSQQESQLSYEDLPTTMMSSHQCPYMNSSNSCKRKGNNLHVRQNYVHCRDNPHLTSGYAKKARRSNFRICVTALLTRAESETV